MAPKKKKARGKALPGPTSHKMIREPIESKKEAGNGKEKS